MAKTPQPKKNPLGWLTEQPFAHRGLHDARENVLPNTYAAFDRAIEQNAAIELDVQASFDGRAMVYHHDSLEDFTELEGGVGAHGSNRLVETKLTGTQETIPLLELVLERIAGRVPVLIEAQRPEDEIHPLCFGIRRALEGYRGPVGVMSFDPEIIAWFARNAPKIWRGLVISDETGGRKPGLWERLGWRQLFDVWRAKPHFIAYDVRSLPSNLSRKLRNGGIPVVAWTIQSQQDRIAAEDYADNFIFEPVPIAST